MLLKYAENRQKQKLSKFILQIVMVSFAAILGGISFKNFFEPAGIIPAGFSGLSLIISKGFASIGVKIPTAVIYLIINVTLFLFALKIFGWKFLVLSALGISFYTLGMQFVYIPALANAVKSDTLLAGILGAIFSGISIGVAMKFGGTTGGSDIAGVIINRYLPKIKTGYCMLLINAIVLTLSVLTSSILTGLYALIVAVVSSLTTNLVLDGSKRVIAHYIICDKDEEIAYALLERYHRGVTKLDGIGMFSKKGKSVLVCLLPNQQSDEMKKIVSAIDHNSFIFSSTVTETLGTGEFLKEHSIFKNKVLNSKIALKNDQKYQRVEHIKKLKLKKKCKFEKMHIVNTIPSQNQNIINDKKVDDNYMEEDKIIDITMETETNKDDKNN